MGELKAIGPGPPDVVVRVSTEGAAGRNRQPVTEAEASKQPVVTSQASLDQNRKAVEAAVEEANRSLSKASLSTRFSVVEETKQIVVQLTDQESGKVIRQIPAEEQLVIEAKLRELMGLLLDSRA